MNTIENRLETAKNTIQNRVSNILSSTKPKVKTNIGNAFVNAIETGVSNEKAYTNNGALTLKSSGKALVDFFFIAAASRGKDIRNEFVKAYAEDADLALRILQHLRDIREGSGERKLFRDLVVEAQKFVPEEKMFALIAKIPLLGRFDDLFCFTEEKYRNFAFFILSEALANGNALAAKWCPRKGEDANAFRKFLGLNPKEYRTLIVSLSNTVETKMCAKQWNDIELSKVPSVAAARYRKAFIKHIPEKYNDFLKKVESGEEKINASAIFPHDVIKNWAYTDSTNLKSMQLQWNALPNYVPEDISFIPMVDVSGSMNTNVSGSTTAMDISMSLGLYLAERNTSAFNNVVINFSSKSEIKKLNGSGIYEKLEEMSNFPWGMSTNLQAAFKNILSHAVSNNVPKEDMPKYLVILSDMEFDQAEEGITNFEAIEKLYEKHNYDRPNIIFWNLNGRSGNVPVRFDQNGTALISGFSPTIFKNLVSGSLDPVKMMLSTINKPRYDL